MSIDVIDIVERWLISNGFDGLVNLDNEGCGCCLGEDFVACSEIQNDCEAAYKHPCKKEECESCDIECYAPGNIEGHYVMRTYRIKKGNDNE